jgi:hypothetical protein
VSVSVLEWASVLEWVLESESVLEWALASESEWVLVLESA